MDAPKLLNNILNIIIYLIILSILIGFVFTALALTGTYMSFISSESISKFSKHTPDIYFFIILNLMVYTVFIYGIIKFKKVAELLLNKKIYDEKLSKNVNISGKCFVICGVFWWLFDSLGSIHFNDSITIGVSEKTFLYLFFIAIGLFMMLVSEVFDSAREEKNLNDLTI